LRTYLQVRHPVFDLGLPARFLLNMPGAKEVWNVA
jgi:hypothetical protein